MSISGLQKKISYISKNNIVCVKTFDVVATLALLSLEY
jgi:hypothetical protein